ncbi:acyl-CoA dehydrogenase family protein [Streptomyces sp. NPDC093589]|uniref:acyl-CoA dehydrogenase family protein n=1 Tax=Streptomyces sp. NPDC093589 TaxID=3366043 RepID=UPI003824D8C0
MSHAESADRLLGGTSILVQPSRTFASEVSDWFRHVGREKVLRQEIDRDFPAEYLYFLKSTGLLERSLVPEWIGAHTDGWTPYRVTGLSEHLAFHSFTHWLMWHVSSLAGTPVWMSQNAAVQKTYAEQFNAGMLGSFGMSERGAGADWRHTATSVKRLAERYVASGGKDYTGNGNVSSLITTFAQRADGGDRDYILFRADSHRAGFELVGNAVPEQMYVSEFRLSDYEFAEDDVISTGPQAFADAVNTINVGKFNLATAATGLLSRALVETYHHTSNRTIFGQSTASFGQNQDALCRATLRLIGMKAYTSRCVDHMHAAVEGDDRYVILNAVAKAKVTHDVTDALHSLSDVISAKGFETEAAFRPILKYAEYLPRLEGTKYVNLMQAVRSAPTFFDFARNTQQVPDVATDSSEAPRYLLTQRKLGGLEKLSFSDHTRSKEALGHLPSVALFFDVVERLGKTLFHRPLDQKNQRKVQAFGEIFAIAVYGTVVAEYARQRPDDEVWESVFSLVLEDLALTLVRTRQDMADHREVADAILAAVQSTHTEWPVDRITDHLQAAVNHSICLL